MAHYKDLNKELVEQVQAMRISLQEHRDEIISLRAKCMRKHENIVFLRKKCKDFAVLHCQQYLEFLEPESLILPHLLEVQNHTPSTPVQRLPNGVENGCIRHSARLTVECRRSSSLTQTRRSFNSTSPIRSASYSEVELVEDNEFESEFESSAVNLGNPIPEEDEECEEEDIVAEEEVEAEVAAVEETSNCPDTNKTLCEADKGEAENNSLKTTYRDDTVERETRTFRDITNTLCPPNVFHKKTAQKTTKNYNEHKNRGKGVASLSHYKSPISTIADDENEDPKIDRSIASPLPDKKLKHVTISRGRCKNKNNTNRHCNPEDNEREIGNKNQSEHQRWLAKLQAAIFDDSDHSSLQDSNTDVSQQESIQEARQMTKGKQQSVEPFYTIGDEVTASSYALSEITLCQFKEATSSTPIHQQRNTMPSSTPGHSSRPKRTCRAKSMVEPLLNTKMRNESGEKSLCCQTKISYKKHK